MVAFAKDCSNSYVAYNHFVTGRINLIYYMLNKFNIEFKESFFRISLQKFLTITFLRFLLKLISNGKPKVA